QVNVHGFSPPEIHFFTKISKLPLRTVLERLKAAGLGSVPGGGAEILVDRVRKAITRGKLLTDDWLNVNRVWHEIGGRSTATMMFGHVETLADRIEHLLRVREVQARSSGFTAFITWPLQPENTEMEGIEKTDATTYLRTVAISRLVLRNVPNLQASWVTMGLKVGQISLRFGCNDFGSLMIEENVVSSAGTTHQADLSEIRRHISDAGFKPARRLQDYTLLPDEKAA
ncbi:MAG: dehypoxanthine futalosine cyclase, partial [Gemmatimonadetes bacterium]|nr:dehypoxanthine futalosine cyclase [Gemmatimonadota bacterium]